MDASLAKSIAEAFEESTEKTMECLASTIFEALANTLSQQLSQIIGTVSVQDQNFRVWVISRNIEEKKIWQLIVDLSLQKQDLLKI